MASIQSERKKEVDMEYEEKVTLDGMLKHAQIADAFENIEKQSLAVVAENEHLGKAEAAKIHITLIAGLLKNQTKGSMSVLHSKKWAGHIVKNYPNPLNGLGAFAQSALASKGIKAAVAYAGKNHAGVECGWLLAWSDTKVGGRKIYAECGPKSKFNNINWAHIEHKLNSSGMMTKYFDIATRTSVYAALADSSSKDLLAAVFAG